MHKVLAILAISGLLAGSAAQAAQDPGPMLHDIHDGSRRLGAAAQVRLTVPLGRAARDDSRAIPRLSLRAGPSITQSGAAIPLGARTTVAPLTELAIRPGYSTTWSIAGQPLAASFSPAALREQRDGLPEGQRNNISTLGVVAIGVGVAVIVGALVLRERLEASSD